VPLLLLLLLLPPPPHLLLLLLLPGTGIAVATSYTCPAVQSSPSYVVHVVVVVVV